MIDLLIRNAEVVGRAGLDVAITDGRIKAIGTIREPAHEVIDAQGGAVIPGLHDHHLHLLASAARASSVDLSDATDEGTVASRLASASAVTAPGSWLRAVALRPALAMALDRKALDRWVPGRPCRIADHSGALWILNSAALARVGHDLPPGAERDSQGRATGRIWREDRWLRAAIGGEVPPLAPIGRQLANFGITGVTDATATTDQATAALLGAAHHQGALPQRLTVMSGDPLAVAPGDGFACGPAKIVLDERALPSFDDLCERFTAARRCGRAIAVHCVTDAELALTLAAFGHIGTTDRDRIEHGAIIPYEAIAEIARLGLTVVTQPAFVHDHGDRYLREIAPDAHADIYRCGSLLRAAIRVAGSSDAPHGTLDPWAAMRAAVARRSATGQAVADGDAITGHAALALYLGHPGDAGGEQRRVAIGAVADLCLLRAPLDAAVRELSADLVAATLIGGHPIIREGKET